MDDDERVYKIALLGLEGVGKTALLVRVLCNRFIGDYDSTIEDCYRRTFTVDGKEMIVDILDTSNQAVTSKRKEIFLREGDGFIVVYSCMDRESYLAIPRFKEMIDESRDLVLSDPVSVVLIENKTDLRGHRSVHARNEGQLLAKSYGWIYGEASALVESEDAPKLFYNLLREIRFKNPVPVHLTPRASFHHSGEVAGSSKGDSNDLGVSKRPAIRKLSCPLKLFHCTHRSQTQ